MATLFLCHVLNYLASNRNLRDKVGSMSVWFGTRWLCVLGATSVASHITSLSLFALLVIRQRRCEVLVTSQHTHFDAETPITQGWIRENQSCPIGSYMAPAALYRGYELGLNTLQPLHPPTVSITFSFISINRNCETTMRRLRWPLL